MKKLTVAVLVLAMIMGMSTMAAASTPKLEATGKGEAGINYEEGKVEVIDEKDLPELPKKEEWDFRSNRDIDFGEHDLIFNATEQKYASWIEYRKDENGVKIDDDSDYVGIIISNGTKDTLSVVVGIEQFTAGGEQTLKGFVLDLVTQGFDPDGYVTNPNGHTVTLPVGAKSISTNPVFDVNGDHKMGKIDAGNDGEDPVTAKILELPGFGIYAATWGGVLTVPQHSVEEIGDAQAIMTWNIMSVPA